MVLTRFSARIAGLLAALALFAGPVAQAHAAPGITASIDAPARGAPAAGTPARPAQPQADPTPASPAAQDGEFPALTGRVVDAAGILSPATEAALTQKLAALETQSQRQLVVATLPDLGGNDVADVGYRLGRAWWIGAKDRNDGVILLIAPNERRMHIAVGYGLEPVLTDALSARIIRDVITPPFKAGDLDGGVTAGVDAIARQLTLPPDEARQVAADANRAGSAQGDGSAFIFWLFVILFIVFFLASQRGGRHYRGRRRGIAPVVIWGGSDWGGGSGSGFGGGGFGGFGGGGGFSGGGGSFGGGGASGGW